MASAASLKWIISLYTKNFFYSMRQWRVMINWLVRVGGASMLKVFVTHDTNIAKFIPVSLKKWTSFYNDLVT